VMGTGVLVTEALGRLGTGILVYWGGVIGFRCAGGNGMLGQLNTGKLVHGTSLRS